MACELVGDQIVTVNRDDPYKAIRSRESSAPQMKAEEELQNFHVSLQVGATGETDDGRRCPSLRQIDPKLLYYKAMYFSFWGALGVIIPFISIYLKQLGQSALQIGIITGVRPVVGVIAAPLCGCLGDWCNIRKALLLVSLVVWCGFSVGFYHLPAPQRLGACPSDLKPERQHALINVRKRHVFHEDFPSEGGSSDAGVRHLYRRSTSGNITPDLQTNNTYNGNLTADDMKMLKEDLSWMYEPGGVQKTFAVSMVLIFGEEMVKFSSMGLSETAVLQTLGPRDLDWYGHQRAWGAMGWAVGAFVAGSIVSTTRHEEDICGVQLYFSDYRVVAYVFIAFMVLAFIMASRVVFNDSRPSEPFDDKGSVNPSRSQQNKASHSTVAVLRLFCNVHYGSWLATAFYVGVCNGVIWGFLYWHLENLGASQMVMAVDSLVMCLAEFCTFFVASPIIRRLGHMNVMYLGLLGYSLRFIVYGVIINPWIAVPVEILQGITYSCVWVSLTSYTALSVPSCSLATIQGILHGVYFGLGVGTGNLLGGILIGEFGARVTFFTFSVTSCVVMLIFLAAQKCSRKPANGSFAYADLDSAR